MKCYKLVLTLMFRLKLIHLALSVLYENDIKLGLFLFDVWHTVGLCDCSPDGINSISHFIHYSNLWLEAAYRVNMSNVHFLEDARRCVTSYALSPD